MKKTKPHIFYYDSKSYADNISSQRFSDWIDQAPDPLLGWTSKRNNPHKFEKKNCLGQIWHASIGTHGQRNNGTHFKHHKISIYGDSFSFGDDVNDNETISHFLSVKSKIDVRNFALGGYGTDQAILRFEQNLIYEKPKVVILGIWSENINRIVNSYRPFYLSSLEHSQLDFKPEFIKHGNTYLLKTPPASFNDLDEVRKYIQESAEYDFWYLYDKYHKAGTTFPFTLSLVKVFKILFENKTWYRDNEVWQLPEAKDKLTYILKRFIKTANDNNIRPIILFMPTYNDIERHQGQNKYSYQDFFDQFQKQNKVEMINLINFKSMDWKKYFLGGDGRCHASPYANEIVAGEIFKIL